MIKGICKKKKKTPGLENITLGVRKKKTNMIVRDIEGSISGGH